jgi:hypothetical protein
MAIQPRTMGKNTWDKLSQNERMDVLTGILTKAGSDSDFRDKCLVSRRSARRAVEDAGNVNLPPDMEVQFVTREEAEKIMIMILPDFVSSKKGRAVPRQATQQSVPCTYIVYRSSERTRRSDEVTKAR